MGWVVGHSFIVYGPLLNRNSSIILKETDKTQMPVPLENY
jgi:acyl-coenzyme A synthetase/AMP-(fatty) acid ligase